jgi:uncharacterized protein DUF3108
VPEYDAVDIAYLADCRTSAGADARKDGILRQAIRCTLAPGALVLAALGSLVPAWAQAKLEARYTATLAGIPIGSGSWAVDVSDTQYAAAASGSTSGLLRAFTGGKGDSTVRGTLNGGRLLSSIYAATISTRKKTDAIRIVINSGNVKDFKVDPPLENEPERVPITEAHQRGVLDPMTASIVRVPGNGDLLSPEACQRSMAIFDGRLRYDVQFAFKRMDKVKSDKGYAGPVVVCAAYFSPVAGYIPSRAAITYLSKLRDMEVWLAPIAGTRVLVPYRAQGPTPIGQAVLEASEFVSVPVPARPTANGPKTQ